MKNIVIDTHIKGELDATRSSRISHQFAMDSGRGYLHGYTTRLLPRTCEHQKFAGVAIMPVFTPATIAGGIMVRHGLDAPGSPRTYALAWRFKDDSDDGWTKRVNSFKEGNEDAVHGAARVLLYAIPHILKHLNWDKDEVGIASAIPSRETTVPAKHQLRRIIQAVCKRSGYACLIDHLQKESHRPLHTLYSRQERRDEVAGKYTADAEFAEKPKLLLIDDIATAGDTSAEVVRAATAAGTEQAALFAFGKSETKSFNEAKGWTLDNSHISEFWAQKWAGTAK